METEQFSLYIRACSLPSINIRASPKLCLRNAWEYHPFNVSKIPQYTMHLSEILYEASCVSNRVSWKELCLQCHSCHLHVWLVFSQFFDLFVPTATGYLVSFENCVSCCSISKYEPSKLPKILPMHITCSCMYKIPLLTFVPLYS